jgi:hypothetical protein
MDPIRKPLKITPSTSRLRPNSMTKDVKHKYKSKEEAPNKIPKVGWEASKKEVEKACPPFNFEHEMAKIKIFVPFNELIRKG